MLGEFQDRAASVGTLGDDHDIFGVFDGHNHSGSNHDFFPGTTQMQEMNSGIRATKDVAFHAVIHIQSSQMSTTHQHLLDIFGFPIHFVYQLTCDRWCNKYMGRKMGTKKYLAVI